MDRAVIHGRDRSPVGRPVFKIGRGRQAVPGRFDSCSLPPISPRVVPAVYPPRTRYLAGRIPKPGQKRNPYP